MSSSKTDSSTNKRQKNPEIKIVDTSFGRFKITEETKDTEEDHPNNHDPNVIKKDVKNPLRIRLEYKWVLNWVYVDKYIGGLLHVYGIMIYGTIFPS